MSTTEPRRFCTLKETRERRWFFFRCGVFHVISFAETLQVFFISWDLGPFGFIIPGGDIILNLFHILRYETKYIIGFNVRNMTFEYAFEVFHLLNLGKGKDCWRHCPIYIYSYIYALW